MITEPVTIISKNNPRITVIIPVKNREKVIGRCLKAIFSQSLKPFEVIVVDGYSADKTVEQVKKFPVKIVYEKYGTIGGARQVGLENANGEYIAFTDSDCMPQTNWLENLVKEFNHEIVGVGGGIKNVGNELWSKTIAIIMNTFFGSANSVQGRLFMEKRIVNSISGCNSMYRRTNLIKVGGFNTSLSVNEDTELNRRLAKSGRLYYIPDAVVIHDSNRGIKDFAQRIYEFGYGRGTLRLWDFQCIPPLIALLIVLSLLITPVIFVGALFFYTLILFVSGIKYSIKEKCLKYLISIPVIYLIEHCSYTLGFLRGLVKSYTTNNSASKKQNQQTS